MSEVGILEDLVCEIDLDKLQLETHGLVFLQMPIEVVLHQFPQLLLFKFHVKQDP